MLLVESYYIQYRIMLWSLWISHIIFAETFKTKINTFSVSIYLLISWFIFRKNCAKDTYLNFATGAN